MTNTRLGHGWWSFFLFSIALTGCAGPRITQVAAQNQAAPERVPVPESGMKDSAGMSSAYAGLRWWRSYQKSELSKFAVPRQRILDNVGLPITAHVAVFSSSRILVDAELVDGDREDAANRIVQVDASQTPVRVSQVKEAARPVGLNARPATVIPFTDGKWYRIFRDEFYPFRVRGMEQIDAQTQRSVWLPLEKAPKGLLQRLQIADLTDIPWQTIDPERTSYWEGALSLPAHLGPLLVRSWDNQVQTRAIPAEERFIESGSLRLWHHDRRTFITAQTTTATAEQVRQRRSDPSYFPQLDGSMNLRGGLYGYNQGAATIYTLSSSAGEKADVWVLKAADFPPLPFLRPHFTTRGSAGETRDALVLPNGSGAVYVWRGRAVWPDLPIPEFPEDKIMRPEQAAKLPTEIFDCVALVLAQRDGTQKVLDFQLGYTRKVTKLYDPPSRIVFDPADPTLNTGKVVDEKPDGRVKVGYRAQYLWTPDENGRIQEQVISRVEGTTFYAEDALQLSPKVIGDRGRLLYFKGRALWMVDLKAKGIGKPD